jgi:hypothetical protein
LRSFAEEVEMPYRHVPVGRIQDVSEHIRALEKRLMGDKPIDLSELAIIHGEIRRMRQQSNPPEKRSR